MQIRVAVLRRPRARFLTVASTVLLATLVAMSMPVRADHSEKYRERHRPTRHEKRIRAYHDREVPRRLSYGERRALRPYYAGRVFYRPHHHHHMAYHFPVFVNGIVMYRPYYYCEDHLFLAAAMRVPRLAISVEFGTPGVHYEPGYYPVPDHHDHDDCDEDEEDDD